MSQWIEVRVRTERTTDNGLTAKVTDSYLVDALSCTEAEARVIREVKFPGEYNVLSVSKTKISEIFYGNAAADRYYKVKVAFITINERTAQEKRTASYILVQAASFDNALDRFHEGMKGTLADHVIESISETKILDVFTYQASAASPQ